MKSKIILALLFLLTLKISAQFDTRDIDSIITLEMIRQNLPGLAVGVYYKGHTYSQGYGHIDLDRTIPITRHTVMRWASISKTLTAVAALQLIEAKSNLSVLSKIADKYPHWVSNVGEEVVSDKARKSNITILHLLTNRSGINYYGKGLEGDATKYTNQSESEYDDTGDDIFNANSAVDIFREPNLAFRPGSNYLYSTYGFNLLGAYIDAVSGSSYPNWVSSNISEILEMKTLNVSNGYFTGFQKTTDGILNELPIGSREVRLPGGGWESNIQDLLKFAKGILDKKLLKNTDDLWKDDGYKDSKGNSQDYRRGISLQGSSSMNNLRVYHGGNHENVTTNLNILPDLDTAIVLMIPMASADRDNITFRILNKLIPRFWGFIDTSPRDICTSWMGSSDKKFFGVWRKTTEDVLIRRGYSRSNFIKEYKFLRENGYYLEDIEPDKTDDGKILWNGIFKEGKGVKSVSLKMNLQEFREKWDKMNSMGLRLYDLETYVENNKRYWAGLFRMEPGRTALWRNFSHDEFATKKQEMAQLGMKLIDIEVHSSGNDLKWSGVWGPGDDNVLLNRGYNIGDFKILINDRKQKGYKLIDVELYLKDGSLKCAGIWEDSILDQEISTILNYCDFMEKHDKFSDDDFELISLHSYTED